MVVPIMVSSAGAPSQLKDTLRHQIQSQGSCVLPDSSLGNNKDRTSTWGWG